MKLIEGHKYIHTDILGKKWELTYTGTRREIKGCEFEFFIDDKGVGCFFSDTEVERMTKKDLRIDYFELCPSGIIYQTYIDTSEKKYISHTEDSVTFTYSYNSYIDCDSETKYEQITKTRVFDVIRQERINSYKELIKDLQYKLSVFENAANYEQYKELIYKKKD